MDTNLVFPENADLQLVLDEFLVLFGIKQDYKALIDLLDILNGYVPFISRSDIPSVEGIIAWERLDELNLALRDKNYLPRGFTRGKANAASGFLGVSPLASAFLSNPSANSKSRFDGLRLVLLVYLIVKKDEITSGKSLCDEVRFSADEIEEQNEILLQLPVFSLETCSHYYANLCSVIKTCSKKLTENTDNFSSKQRNFITHLAHLVKIPIQKTHSTLNKVSMEHIAHYHAEPKAMSGSLYVSQEPNESAHDEAPIQKILFEDDDAFFTENSEESFTFSVKQARYWIERNESLSEIDSSRLNPLEKNILVHYIKTICSNKNFDESLPGFLIALVYLTGFDLNRLIYTRFGTVSFLDTSAQLIKELPEPPIAYQNSANKSSNITVKLSLPLFIQQWMNTHQSSFKHCSSFLQASNCSAEVLTRKVKQELEHLRDGGRYRIKLQRLQSCLASELTINFRDPVITSIISGDFKIQPPVLMYYRAITPSEVKVLYEKTSNSLLLQLPKDLLVETQFSVSVVPDSITAFIHNISIQTTQSIRNYPADIVTAHNAIAQYSVAMLSFALGHRPVVDPHCYFNEINPDLIASLVNDKVVDPRHQYRYQAFPSIAIKQLCGYLWHLKRLAITLIRKKTDHSERIGNSIIKMLRGQKQQLPLFFLLEDFKQSTKSISPKVMKEYWQCYGDIPLNAGRSVIATELSNAGISAPTIELYLGHFHGITHPWGDRSSRVPVVDTEILSKKVDIILKNMGWHVIVPKLPERDRLRLDRRIKKDNFVIHESSMLGPVRRELNRKKRLAKQKALLKEQIQNCIDDKSQSITAHELSLLREAIINQAKSQRLSLQECLLLLNRWLSQKVIQGVYVEGFKKMRPLHLELSPFDKNTYLKHHELQQIQKSLELFTACNAFQDPSMVYAELLLRSTCLGGLSHIEHLKQLPKKILKNCYQLNGQVFIEFDKFRWYPDNTSLGLIIYLNKRKKDANSDDIANTKIIQALLTLLHQFNINVTRKAVYDYLSSLAATFQKIYLPGFIRIAWSKDYPSSNVSIKTYSRLLTNKRIKYIDNDSQIAFSDDQQGWLPSISFTIKTGTKSNAKVIWREFQFIFAHINNDDKTGNVPRASARRTQLAKAFKGYIESHQTLPQIAHLLVIWIIARCEKGVKKSKLAPSTIYRYLQELAMPLLHLVGNKNWLQFTAEDFDELFIQVLDWGNNVDQPYRLGRLFDFHQFIYHRYGTEQPNWSMLFSLAGENAPIHEIDANLLTVNEYDTALTLIQNDTSLSDWLKNRYSLLLILGFRFGLRFGEAMRIQWRDVQLGENQAIFLQIHNNVYGKVKSVSGIRQVPLLGGFSDQEKTIFDTVMQQAETWFGDDIQVALMFTIHPRQLIDRDNATRYLNALLKHVSADPSLRFHHLRHTWVTRAIATAYPVPSSKLWTQIRDALIGRLGESHASLFWGKNNELSQKLQAISDAAGHARIQTTISSYFHMADVLGSAYLAQYKIEMPIKILSKIVNKSEHALYKRRSRVTTDNLTEDIIKGEKLAKLFPSPLSSMTLIKKQSDWSSSELNSLGAVLDLQSVVRIMLLVRRRGGDVSNLGTITGVEQKKIDNIILNAVQIELDTGFDYYRMYLASDNPFIKKPQSMEFKQNQLEENRISLIASKISSVVEKQFKPVIVAWRTSYDYRKNEWKFKSIVDLNHFLSGLTAMGIKGSLELKIPDSMNLATEVVKKLSTQCQITRINDVSVQKKRPVTQYITLAVIKLPARWKTFNTVNHMLFCIAVFVSVNQNQIGHREQ